MKNTYKRRDAVAIVTVLIALTTFYGCKKLIEVEAPIDQIVSKEVYNSDATANAVLIGIFTRLSNSMFTGQGLSMKAGLSADELIPVTDPSNLLSILYTNSLTNEGDQLFWQELYELIFRANSAIEGIGESTKMSDKIRGQLLGEAKFLRAFAYFYLVNLYGDVPLLTSTEIQKNSLAGRVRKSLVYDQIVKDLKEAQLTLSEEYLDGNSTNFVAERLRPNRSTATALLARVYLFIGNWEDAEEESTNLIEDKSLFKIETLERTFLKDSKEAIWQLQPTEAGVNTYDAQAYVLAEGDGVSVPGPNGFERPVYLSNYIYDEFEVGDRRKDIWTAVVTVDGNAFPYSFKYKIWERNKPRQEYLVMFRLAEQFLIRAESRANLGKLSGANSALDDINVIRHRAGLKDFTDGSKESIIDEILTQRKFEFFLEFGHRWLDLKRTGKVDEIMSKVAPSKHGVWLPYKSLYPIPVTDLRTNPNLKNNQNPGYPSN
ncbi:RagB/SusD family nutrient uptake outer membrane protein [Pedobacter faecalis]|uniref:RagB/SusD family nutrient uptake outer membrane protein n=1 Tax=Pedobacter faecalis TaxID=3041495 RepID=UPI00254C431F|nr:RagB/SusD family nutrient uptake outer membrane protein [Pedobacter sp. ELA7]